MKYNFAGELLKEGKRTFIPIPFNVWEECNQKGMLPVVVTINNITFECKLTPKGKGYYYIPINKGIISQLDNVEDLDMSFEIITGLTRINKNSPYTIENPIRIIDSIKSIIQPQDGMCGQTCVAMLAGITVEEVVKVMNARKWQASISKVIETLDYYGISHSSKMVYGKTRFENLPKCCILNVHLERCNHLLLFYNGKYYDPSLGVLEEYDKEKIIGYLEIFLS
ncbi:DUF1905 domain-containing protein [Sporosalibacterium faouarense]|uniref:DUF1905 domain-containing protein n=1 Tax=Sporosalibacterium faouarense TaxID=516123 RepID=UPI00141D62A3|nr:DUF1905 domain-containing protein [Bacillota bacterium]